MSVFFPARQTRDLGDPGQPLIPLRTSGGLGRSTAGQSVNFDLALTLSAVWAAVRLRADVVSMLPLRAYRAKPDGSRDPMSQPSLLQSPVGSTMTLREWLFASQVSLDLRGNCFGQVLAMDGYGFPTQVELLDPEAVRVQVDRYGKVTYLLHGADRKPHTRWPLGDIWHERQFVTAGAHVGLSMISYAAAGLGTAIAAEQFGAQWFSDGAHPTSVWRNKSAEEVPQPVARAFKDRLMALTRGNREPVVVGSGWEQIQLQVGAAESQFLEEQRWSVEQVARWTGVPVELIGGSVSGSALTYANREQRNQDFVGPFSIGPTLSRREESLSMLLPNRQTLRFDADDMLRADYLTRWQGYNIAIRDKVLSQDEVRAKEFMPPLTAEQIAQLKKLEPLKPSLATEPAGVVTAPSAVQEPQ